MIQAGFKSILSFEMIDKKLIYDKSLGLLIPDTTKPSEERSNSANSQLGYSSDSIIRLLSMIVIGVLIFATLGFLFASIYLFFYKKFTKSLKKVTDNIKGKIFFNTILRTTIQQYIDISISTMLALKSS